MVRCTMVAVVVAVAVVGWANAVVGGEFTYVADGTGEYTNQHVREWTECITPDSPPMPSYYYHAPPISGIFGPLNYSYSGSGASWGDNQGNHYQVRLQIPTDITAIHCLGNYWTWRVDYTDGISQYNVSYWGSPGALDELNLYTDPTGHYTTDAGDAALMFLYWGTPVADFTGDAMTDAADAGRLFEEWTGDTAPVSVPEPSSLSWFLLLGVGKCHDIVRSRRRIA